MEVLDPTYGDRSDGLAPVSRPASLDGLTVGIISNGKRGTSVFFDALDRELRRRHGASEVVRVTKPNYSAPAGGEILDGAARWHALVAGVGD
jgi:hypothetical protein